jgi:hypothetical protein
VITRAAAVPALAALAVIHVVDLPVCLGPDRLAGFRCLGIIAVAIVAGAAMVAGLTGWPGRPLAGSVPLRWPGMCSPRALPGGFLGDHGNVGDWRSPLGITVLRALAKAASSPRR